MNSKIVSKQRISAIFLATILVVGTITAISPSFIIGLQAQPYYGYNSYESQYQSSYKPAYKPEYQSYGKDIRDKSKDSSDIINKIKCTTNNIVVNGNNTGDINIGNKGGVAAAEEGDWSASSFGGSGYGYDNNKKDKDFECIIKNNNIINNVVAGAGGGNVTDGNATDTCEECFLDALGPEGLAQFEAYLATSGSSVGEDLIGYCITIQNAILNGATPASLKIGLTNILNAAGMAVPEIDALVACLFEVLG